MWMGALFAGSVLLSGLWFFERTSSMVIKTWVFPILPILILSELFYWYAFKNAPNFWQARYYMSAMTNTLGIAMAMIFLGETMSIKTAIGIAMIITGGIILR